MVNPLWDVGNIIGLLKRINQWTYYVFQRNVKIAFKKAVFLFSCLVEVSNLADTGRPRSLQPCSAAKPSHTQHTHILTTAMPID